MSGTYSLETLSVEALESAFDEALEAEWEAMGAAAKADQDVVAAGVRTGRTDDHAGPEWVAYRNALATSVEKDIVVLERVDYRIMIAAEIAKRSEA